MKNELHIALGSIERGGAGGGIAAVLKALYNSSAIVNVVVSSI
jgi:glycerate kinase